MQNGIPVGLRSSPSFGLSRSGQLTAIIQSLFWDGSQGWWYDDNDTTTLFQDSAGTTPVTAVEQFVGLQLDKSKGLVLGPELVAPIDFTSGWSSSGAAVTFNSATSYTAAGVANVFRSFFTVGVWYKLEIRATFTGGFTLFNATSATNQIGSALVSGQTQTVYFSALAAQLNIRATSAGTITINSISVRELPGNHRYQTTSGSRPVWSKRVNLFEKTEQFDDAYWTLTDTTITPNATTAPNNTLTADLMTATAGTGLRPRISSFSASTITNVAYTASWYIKPDTYTFVQIYINNQGSEWVNFTLTGAGTASANGSCTASISLDNNGFYRVVMTYTAGSTDRRPFLIMAASGSAARAETWNPTGAEKIFIWGADLRPANQATGTMPLYQRVNTSTDYDTNGFPGYLKADGVDDFLQTNSINFTATDKITLCAGVRKLSDAASAMFAELSVNAVLNTGAFNVQAPVTGGNSEYRYLGGGTTVRNVLVSGYAAPITNVLTGVQDISGDSILLRINGTQVGSTNLDQGTGNLGNYPAYFFRRGGTTLPFNGNEYGNVAVGKLLTADQLTALETYMNGLTKAY